MTGDGETAAESNKPDGFQRRLFVISLLAFFLALCLWSSFARPFKDIYQQLGMAELPPVTELTVTAANAPAVVLPVTALVLGVVGVFALKKANQRTLSRLTAIIFIVAALMPGYVYFAVQMPIVKLNQALGGRP